MAEGAPALPWAAGRDAGDDVKPVQDAHAATGAQEGDVQPVDMQAVGLDAGARIEVMWEVTTDAAEAQSRWFPASISPSSSSNTSAQDATTTAAAAAAASTAAGDQPSTTGDPSKQPQHQQLRYTLKYDGSEEFPEETATILLLSEHELYDLERRDSMWWRREGDAFEPPAESESEEEEMEEGTEGPLINAHNMDVQSAEEEAAAEAAMMTRLSSLSQSSEQQEYMVRGYQDFKNQFKAFVQAKMSCADDGANVVITTADVQEFTAMMNTQRKTGQAIRR